MHIELENIKPESPTEVSVSIAAVKAAIYRVVDDGWDCEDVTPICDGKHPWHFDPADESEAQTGMRTRFVDAVLARIAHTQPSSEADSYTRGYAEGWAESNTSRLRAENDDLREMLRVGNERFKSCSK